MAELNKYCRVCAYHDLSAVGYPCIGCYSGNKFLRAENSDISEDQKAKVDYSRPENSNIPEDQKAKADYGKEKLTLVPRRIIHDICAVRMYGNKKYGDPDNWKQVEPERYRDAAFRHFLAYLDDPYGVDEESGMPHRWHLCCNLAFLCELEDSDEREN